MIYIITVCWNNSADTIKLIESLHQIDENFTLIISDNYSDQESQLLLNAHISQVEKFNIIKIKNIKNGGYAYGVNNALQFALKDLNSRFFWILNNDTIVTKHSLSSLITKFTESDKNGICGSTLIYDHDKNKIQSIGGRYNSWLGTSSHILGGDSYSEDYCIKHRHIIMDYIVGASMFVSREFVETVGLMDEQYFLYSEEADWAFRGSRLGFSLSYAPDSIIFHKEGATTESSSRISRKERSDLADKLYLRSQLILSMKFHPIKHIITRIFFLARFAKRMARGDFKGAFNVIYAALTIWKVKTSIPKIDHE